MVHALIELVAWLPLLAQAATPAADTVTPWLTAGSATASVGALVYIARLFANGSLVARQPAESEKYLVKQADVLTDLLKESHERERELITVIKSLQQMAAP